MLPSKRILTLSYHEKNFTDYALLILTLRQAEKNHVITIWNSQQRPMGTAPLPEVHANCLRYMRTLRNLIRMGTPSLEVQLAEASAREPANHVANSRRKKMFLSLNMIRTTKPLVTSVVVIIMWQRSVGSRNI